MISIGIDIGDFSLKVAEIESSGKSFDVRQFQDIPLSTDPSKDHDIEILDILRQIQSKYAQANVKYVVSLPDSSVTFRRRFFPFKERHKILKSLPFELEDDIPFDQEDCVFEAKVSRYVDNQADVLSCACPSDKIEKYVQIFQDAGIEPDILSVESAALANLFELWREAPIETSSESDESMATNSMELVLDLGHDSTRLIFLKDGYLFETHQFDWGGKDLAESISKKYSIHFVEALKELQKKSFVLINSEGATEDQVNFSNILKEQLNDLCHKLNFVLMDIKAEHNANFNNLTLMGGTSQIKNLGPYLTQQLHIPCNRLKQLSMIPKMDFESNQNHELQCATAFGLAFEGLKKPKNPALNLLQGEFAKQGQNLKLFWEKWSYSIKVAGAIYLVLLVYSFLKSDFSETMADKANSVLRSQAKKVAKLSGTKASNRNINKFINRRQKQAKNRELVQDLQNINSALDIVEKISLNVPKKSEGKIDVKRLLIRNDRVQMEGTVGSRSLIPKIRQALKGLSKNGKVKTYPKVTPGLRGKNTFAFEWQIERNSRTQ